MRMSTLTPFVSGEAWAACLAGRFFAGLLVFFATAYFVAVFRAAAASSFCVEPVRFPAPALFVVAGATPSWKVRVSQPAARLPTLAQLHQLACSVVHEFCRSARPPASERLVVSPVRLTTAALCTRPKSQFP